jgi:hypothetical protein
VAATLPTVEYQDIQGWVGAAKGALDLVKSAWAMLPKGKNRDEIEAKIRSAEEGLARSDAKLARALGMQLCECTFPPQIMLWKEAEQAHVCPNSSCNRRMRGVSINRGQGSWVAARRGN